MAIDIIIDNDIIFYDGAVVLIGTNGKLINRRRKGDTVCKKCLQKIYVGEQYIYVEDFASKPYLCLGCAGDWHKIN